VVVSRQLRSYNAIVYTITRCSSASADKVALNASLIVPRRVGGKIMSEHVGALGSVDADMSARERFAFWAKLPQRLASLGNRVGVDQCQSATQLQIASGYSWGFNLLISGVGSEDDEGMATPMFASV
jgi:hypothetical protein